MNSKLPWVEKLYFKLLEETRKDEDQSAYLLKIYSDLVSLLSEASGLQFNTLFARLSYIISRYNLSPGWSYALQIPRRELRQRQLSHVQLNPILCASIEYLIALCKSDYTTEGRDHVVFPDLPALPASKRPGRYKKKYARVIAIEWDQPKQILTILDEDTGMLFFISAGTF